MAVFSWPVSGPDQDVDRVVWIDDRAFGDDPPPKEPAEDDAFLVQALAGKPRSSKGRLLLQLLESDLAIRATISDERYPRAAKHQTCIFDSHGGLTPYATTLLNSSKRSVWIIDYYGDSGTPGASFANKVRALTTAARIAEDRILVFSRLGFTSLLAQTRAVLVPSWGAMGADALIASPSTPNQIAVASAAQKGSEVMIYNLIQKHFP